jgi:hypothetical protein
LPSFVFAVSVAPLLLFWFLSFQLHCFNWDFCRGHWMRSIYWFARITAASPVTFSILYIHIRIEEHIL